MPERSFLGIVPVHGRTEIFEARDLTALKEGIDAILERPKADYPHADLEAGVRILSVRLLSGRQRRFWEKL